jgi:hypothetical protein
MDMDMDAEPRPASPQLPPGNSGSEGESPPEPHRLFLHEPGWTIAQKVGSERSFCYQMAPGQDYYHRLLDGEIYVHHGDERFCLACAQRRGLLSFEPKGLRTPVMVLELAIQTGRSVEEIELDLPPDSSRHEPGEGKPAW